MTATVISGALGIVAAATFLGWMAYSIAEWPLWIITAGVIIGMIADFVGALREG